MNSMKSIAYLFIALLLTGCFPGNDLAKREMLVQGITMGTVAYHIKYVADPKTNTDVDKQSVNIHQGVEAILKQLNQDMSTWIPDSELSTFNRSTSLKPVEVSEGLRRVIKESIRLGHLSEGKLDVTVGPLVNLWGFGPESRPEKQPTDEEIAQAKARVGIEHLTLVGNNMSKAIPNLYVDLSTIAKGYAVDLVAEYLEQQGFNDYLVEIGGELRVKGFKHTGELWHVAIEKPISEGRAVQQVIVPRNNAVATSGDYRKYFEEDGQRFSHIIDPGTGKPINHKLVSVTVIHPSSMTADGLSTAMMVMGEEKALAFAEDNQLAAYLIIKTDDGFVEQSTVKFMQYLK